MNKFSLQIDILALDFDGVVVDSIGECLVVSYNALAIHQGRPDRIADLSQLDTEIIQEARRIRNFIRHGQDYVFIQLALEQKVTIENQPDFDRFLEAYKSLNADFREIFYGERTRFLEDKPEQWLTLNLFYAGMQEFLGKFQPKEHLYIITNKLKENVLAIVDAAKIDIIPENIYSADSQLTKTQIIQNLLYEKGIHPEQFHFIDDQVDTLIKAKSTFVSLYLAEWGYNNTGQIQRARENDLELLLLTDFYRLFGGFMSPKCNK